MKHLIRPLLPVLFLALVAIQAGHSQDARSRGMTATASRSSIVNEVREAFSSAVQIQRAPSGAKHDWELNIPGLVDDAGRPANKFNMTANPGSADFGRLTRMAPDFDRIAVSGNSVTLNVETWDREGVNDRVELVFERRQHGLVLASATLVLSDREKAYQAYTVRKPKLQTEEEVAALPRGYDVRVISSDLFSSKTGYLLKCPCTYYGLFRDGGSNPIHVTYVTGWGQATAKDKNIAARKLLALLEGRKEEGDPR